MHTLTYPGDHTAIIGEVVGPGLAGRVHVATDATYDEATDTTRVQFDEAQQIPTRDPRAVTLLDVVGNWRDAL